MSTTRKKKKKATVEQLQSPAVEAATDIDNPSPTPEAEVQEDADMGGTIREIEIPVEVIEKIQEAQRPDPIPEPVPEIIAEAQPREPVKLDEDSFFRTRLQEMRSLLNPLLDKMIISNCPHCGNHNYNAGFIMDSKTRLPAHIICHLTKEISPEYLSEALQAKQNNPEYWSELNEALDLLKPFCCHSKAEIDGAYLIVFQQGTIGAAIYAPENFALAHLKELEKFDHMRVVAKYKDFVKELVNKD